MDIEVTFSDSSYMRSSNAEMNVCYSDDVTLAVRSDDFISNLDVRWYKGHATGGIPIGTSVTDARGIATYTVPNVTKNAVYYAESFDGFCPSSSRTYTNVTVTDLLVSPELMAIPSSGKVNDRCGETRFTVRVTNPQDGVKYHWAVSSGCSGCSGLSPFSDLTDVYVFGGKEGSIEYDRTIRDGGSRTFHVVAEKDGCFSERSTVVASTWALPAPPDPVPSQSSCGNSSFTFGVSDFESGDEFDWYLGGLKRGTTWGSNLFHTDVLTVGTYDYYVKRRDANGCFSADSTKFIELTVHPEPSELVLTSGYPKFVCSGMDIEMQLSVNGVGGKEYHWERVDSQGRSLGKGVNVTSVNVHREVITEDVNYNVWLVDAVTGCVGESLFILVDLPEFPGLPTVADDSVCGDGNLSLVASSSTSEASESLVFRWYTSEGAAISSSIREESGVRQSTFTPTDRETKLYYVSVANMANPTCESGRVAVQATFNPLPLKPRIDSSRVVLPCDWGGPATLFAHGSGGDDIRYYWFNTREEADVADRADRADLDGVRYSENTTGYTTSSLERESLLNTYYVRARNIITRCWSAGITRYTAGVHGLPDDGFVVTGSSVCDYGSGGIVTLEARSGGKDEVAYWYSDERASDEDTVATGYLYSVRLSATTSYWVAIKDTVTGCFSDTRKQVTGRVLKNEFVPAVSPLTKCGFGEVTLRASSREGAVYWYRNLEDSNEDYLETNTSLCREDCFEVVHTRDDNGEHITHLTTDVFRTTSFYASVLDENGCYGPRVEGKVLVEDRPIRPEVIGGFTCGRGSVELSVRDVEEGVDYIWHEFVDSDDTLHIGSAYTTAELVAVGFHSYYVEAVHGTTYCRSILGRTEVLVEVLPKPDVPLSEASVSRCGAGSVTFEMGVALRDGSEYYWYESLDSGEEDTLRTGRIYEVAMEETDSVYVAIRNEHGCFGGRAKFVGVIDDLLLAPDVVGAERCGQGEVTLWATPKTEGGVIKWYGTELSDQSLYLGGKYTVDVGGTRSYWVEESASGNECVSPRVEVRAMVHSNVEVDMGEDLILCVNGEEHDLAGDLEEGVDIESGTFEGTGVTGGRFYPAIAGVGDHTITFIPMADPNLANNCLIAGSRVVTVLDVDTDGGSVILSEERVDLCTKSGSLDLNDYLNIEGGTWTIDGVSGDAFRAGSVFDPAEAGEGEYVAMYAINVNDCDVINELILKVVEAPVVPVLVEPASYCLGDVITVSVDNLGDASDVYRWFSDDESDWQETGNEVELLVADKADSFRTYSVIRESVIGNTVNCVSDTMRFTIGLSDITLDFDVSIREIELLDETFLVFTASSSEEVNIVEYRWDFGEEGVSTYVRDIEEVTYGYFSAGVFDVSLTVKTEDNCEYTLVKESFITVTDGNQGSNNGGDGQVVGLEDEGSLGVSIFPQPFHDVLNIKFPVLMSDYVDVEMFSLSGALVYDGGHQVSGDDRVTLYGLGSLPGGVYVLRFAIGKKFESVRVFKR